VIDMMPQLIIKLSMMDKPIFDYKRQIQTVLF
jgi:hypothetical protein